MIVWGKETERPTSPIRFAWNRSRTKMPHSNGFSLLEVIIATAILVASSMVLLRLLSIGAKHQTRAERLANAQIICQTLLDQWLIEPAMRLEAQQEPVPGESGWLYDAEFEPSLVPGLIRVRIAVFSEVKTVLGESKTDFQKASTFELVRWMRNPVEAVVQP